ncbi:hypothetical protein BRPE64_CCDS06280 [Caballeronia insecticola]|uniref:Uncharacterized protein n=1 Tax=Caballeronia insecticola TaxID=758793 RepID=R4X2G5_9BURK|nr:hypothetical protein BRPE64_CCDS06280 [Caballeronia insecticola]
MAEPYRAHRQKNRQKANLPRFAGAARHFVLRGPRDAFDSLQ